MSETHVENIQASLEAAHENENKKNVVEIFRNSNAEEKPKEKVVKVFYDNYHKGHNPVDSKVNNILAIIEFNK